MPDGNLLLTLRQINICLGLYESEKLAASEMTFAQAFLGGATDKVFTERF